MKRINRKNKILISWLLNYCIVLLVTFVSVFITYHITKDLMRDENIKNNRLLIDAIRSDCDEILQKIEETVLYVSKDESVRNIARSFTEPNGRAILELNGLKERLNNYNGADTLAGDYYLYFGNLDRGVSGYNVMDAMEICNKYSVNMNVEEWKDLLCADTGNELVRLDTKNGENAYIYVMHSFFTNKYGTPNVSLAYILQPSDFRFIKDEKISGMNIYIKKQDINTELLKAFDVDFDINGVDFNNEIFKEVGKKYLYSACKSNVWNVQYVILSSEKSVFAKLGFLKNIYIGISAAALLLGLSIAYYFARENYNSIEKISKSLSIYAGESDDISTLKGLSEFTVNMVKNYTKIVNENISRREKIQKEFIKNLLHSERADAESLIEQMKLNNIKFQSSKFAVMIIQVEDNVNMLMNYDMLIKIVSEVCSIKHSATVVEENGFFVCLINFNEGIDNKTLENDITEMKNSICSVTKNGSFIDMSFAASRVVTGMDKINIAFIEAMSVMDYKIMSKRSGVLFLNDIRSFDDSTSAYYTLEQEKSLIKAVIIGRNDVAMDIIIEVIKSVANDGNLVSMGYRMFAYDIESSLLKAAVQIGNEAVSFMVENNIEFEAEIKKAITSDTLIGIMSKILDGLCGFVNKNINKVKSLEELVMDNIYKNYTNYDLSLQSIAGELGLHPVYLSSSFKSQYGEGINTRIEKFRLNKAFELLENGETVSRAAEAVGYANVQTFSKAFKRNYGMTPSTITQKR